MMKFVVFLVQKMCILCFEPFDVQTLKTLTHSIDRYVRLPIRTEDDVRPGI